MTEVQEDKDQGTDHVSDQEDRIEEEVDRDHVIDNEIDPILKIEVTLEDMILQDVLQVR